MFYPTQVRTQYFLASVTILLPTELFLGVGTFFRLTPDIEVLRRLLLISVVQKIITNHKLFLNWSKTKFMIINNTKAGARHPVNIELENNLIEVVPEFKLHGCSIDDKLRFARQKSLICRLQQTLYY